MRSDIRVDSTEWNPTAPFIILSPEKTVWLIQMERAKLEHNDRPLHSRSQ